jgi:linearmycin/streptolysin S transport system ATP-binding protein
VDAIIVIRDLVKRYGDHAAVRGVSFSIEKGEIFGLLGPNGAGKTTTLSMVSTLLTPTSGTITIAGHDSRRDADRIKALCGFVPQDLALYPTLSAWDNLVFFGRIYGLRGPRLKERVGHALEAVGLQERARDTVDTFSGGMKRRVNLAAALVHEPKILFLDEPTVGVDPQSRNHIFETVERLSGEGTTVLYTTHYMEEAERLCGRVAIIDQGRILALDTPKALVATLGGSVIEVGLGEVVDGILDRLKAIPAVTSAQLSDRTLSLRTGGVTVALAPVINALTDGGAVINALNIREPNLETVFLHLTGKQLRD